MPLPQIAVEIVVPEAPTRGSSQKKNPVESSELRRALLQACSDTVQVAVCVNADSARGAAALALVFWKGSAHVRIEVGSKDAPGSQTWSSREIDFAPHDALVERWRAAGYAAGTLASLVVRGTRAKESATAAPSTASEPPARANESPSSGTAQAPAQATEKVVTPGDEQAIKPRRPDEPSSGERRPTREQQASHAPTVHTTRSRFWTWSFDGAVDVGPGITAGTWRTGGLIRLSRAFRGPFVTVSAGYAEERERDAGFSARWVTPALGVGYGGFVGAGLGFEARAELVAEWLEGHAEDTVTGEASAASRWLVGGRAGAAVAWSPVTSVALLVGATAEVRGPKTDIFVRDEVRGTTPVFTYGFQGGLRFIVW